MGTKILAEIFLEIPIHTSILDVSVLVIYKTYSINVLLYPR